MQEILLNFLSTPSAQHGAFIVLAILIPLWFIIRIVGSGRLLAFNTPTGKVLVTRSAIKGLIARTCCTIEGVAHPQSRIYTRGGKLRVRVYIQLRGNNRLSDVSTLLQEKLDLALRQNLGIERIGKIDVVVTDIQPSSKLAPRTTAKAAAGYPWNTENYSE